MPLHVEIEIKGLKEIQAAIKRYPVEAQKNFGQAVYLSAGVLATAIRNSPRTPVDTGFMVNKTGYTRVGAWAAMTFVATKYAVVVHQGIPTDVMLEKPVNVFLPGVGWRRITKIKARPARPFVQYALDDGAQKRIDAIMAAALKMTLRNRL